VPVEIDQLHTAFAIAELPDLDGVLEALPTSSLLILLLGLAVP
jgi:hypothetical protein